MRPHLHGQRYGGGMDPLWRRPPYSSCTRGSGWAPPEDSVSLLLAISSGASWECHTAQSRQARPAEARAPRQGAASRGGALPRLQFERAAPRACACDKLARVVACACSPRPEPTLASSHQRALLLQQAFRNGTGPCHRRKSRTSSRMRSRAQRARSRQAGACWACGLPSVP